MFSQNRLKILSVLSLALLSSASLLLPSKALAQIIPDKTTGTQVIPNLAIQGISSELITAGTVKGNNLFHSFQELNIASDRGLYFNNPANITNIFTRVTGSNPSNILGRLGVLGTANLFLLNPYGLLFGENSSLALSGSLYATTSDRLRFADNSTFSTINPESGAILSSTIPIGLGFGSSSNNGIITVRSQADPIFPLPLPPEILQVIRPPVGLITSPNKTLALIGNQINIENNGSLFSLGGQIEVSGIRNGEVELIPYDNRFGFGYSNIADYGNITVSDNARLINIGLTEGNINIIGKHVEINDIGLISTGSLSKLFSGKISVRASELIELIGLNQYEESVRSLTSTNPDTKNNNGLFSFSSGTSNGGDIYLESPQLIMRNGVFVVSSILLAGNAGNITIKAPQSVILNAGAIFSGTSATATGSAGNVEIQTGNLTFLNNGVISSTSLGAGQGGGDIVVDAKRSIEVFGSKPIFTSQNIPITGGIITTTVSNAIAGNVIINTPLLSLYDGGVVTTETQGNGQGGTVSITADRINLSGIDPSNQFPSGILSVARNGSTGNGGSISIITKDITIQNDATVSVASFGTSNAGNLKIVADNLSLDRQGSLLASSNISGVGGNINLQILGLLSLQNNSQILASSGGTGNSGNIDITSGIFIGLGNSQINANAVTGNGGNILINTKGLFFSTNSMITASSVLGVSGNVAISNLDLSTKNAFIPTVEGFVKVDAIIANSCLARRNAAQGSFVVTGSGGLPESPYNQLASEYPVTSIQPIPNSTINSHSPINPSPIVAQKYNQQDQKNWRLGDPIVEVRGLVKSQNGEILPVITYADANALGCTQK